MAFPNIWIGPDSKTPGDFPGVLLLVYGRRLKPLYSVRPVLSQGSRPFFRFFTFCIAKGERCLQYRAFLHRPAIFLQKC